MKKLTFAVVLSLICLSTSNLYAAGYSGGSGTWGNPYQIASVLDWQTLMATPGDWSSYFILTADISLEGQTMTPVGNVGTKFTGVFDGNGHVIRNVEINTPGSDYVGLFGYVFGEINNLGVEEVNIRGHNFVGGLVGWNDDGTITDCYATGTVSGVNYIGGLMGRNKGTITECYATGTVSGSGWVGGLVGYNYAGTITTCYATGTVSGNYYVGGLVGVNNSGGTIITCYATATASGSDCIGGLMGYNYQGKVIHCYSTGKPTGFSSVGGLCGVADSGGAYEDTGNFWDTDTSEISTSAMGTGQTTVLMQTLWIFTSAGWDFSTTDGDDADWHLPPSSYPRLAWENLPPPFGYSGGKGTVTDPYKIASVLDWQTLMATPGDWSSCFIVMAEIDMDGQTMTPVGNYYGTAFTGVFDGNGHVIRNIEINIPGSDFVGLFGCVSTGGQIKNLGVEEVNIQGSSYVGGLVGFDYAGTIAACYATGHVTGTGSYVGGLVGDSYGTITTCYATGTVSGSDYVGGLVGYSYGTITTCYATGNVTGTGNYVGGLVGFDYTGTITTCYATGNVTGTGSYVGGLVGNQYAGTIATCYATGAVSGNYDVGGLVGENDYGTITDCYATGTVSGGNYVGGLLGYNYQGKAIHCYSTGKPTGVSSVGGLCGEVEGGGAYEDTGNFWDTDTSEISTSAMGTGQTTDLMQTLSTFTGAGWDFSTTDGDAADWRMPPSSYPRLAWENLPPYCGDADHPYPAMDFNQDCRVDLADFAMFAAHWLECTAPECD